MIPRYSDPRIRAIFSDEAKVLRWDEQELAVIQARVKLDRLPAPSYGAIVLALQEHPCDINWWKNEEKDTGHDLIAYVNERRRHLPVELRYLFHQDLTSFDTEEAPFARSLTQALEVVFGEFHEFELVMNRQALAHRYTLKLGRSHGQGAKLATLGGEFITWRNEFVGPLATIETAKGLLGYSRLSGAIGNYGGNLSPELEEETLKISGFEPFYGATQIMPRTMYAPAAQSLLLFCYGLAKIAKDIRLGARSGNPTLQEPFGRKQKGSSAMPHKRNPITTEQMAGMLRAAKGHVNAIVDNCQTEERRDISQSSVERMAWPDLFHIVVRMITSMRKVVDGLVVYPDALLREIVESRGTYATDEVKGLLAREFGKRNIPPETAYEVVQLACFNVFTPPIPWMAVRRKMCGSLDEADTTLRTVECLTTEANDLRSIQAFIPLAELKPTIELDHSKATVDEWNVLLSEVFADDGVRKEWDELFRPSRLLAQEAFLFEKLLDS